MRVRRAEARKRELVEYVGGNPAFRFASAIPDHKEDDRDDKW